MNALVFAALLVPAGLPGEAPDDFRLQIQRPEIIQRQLHGGHHAARERLRVFGQVQWELDTGRLFRRCMGRPRSAREERTPGEQAQGQEPS